MYFAKVCIKTSKMESHELNKTLYTKERCPKLEAYSFGSWSEILENRNSVI